MVDAQLGCEYADDDMIFGGDGAELLSNTLSIIASFYAGLLRQCDNCANLYRDALEDPETLKEVFETVYEAYQNDELEDCYYDMEEDEDFIYNEPIPFRKKSKDGFKGGEGLCGLDEFHKK